VVKVFAKIFLLCFIYVSSLGSKNFSELLTCQYWSFLLYRERLLKRRKSIHYRVVTKLTGTISGNQVSQHLPIKHKVWTPKSVTLPYLTLCTTQQGKNNFDNFLYYFRLNIKRSSFPLKKTIVPHYLYGIFCVQSTVHILFMYTIFSVYSF
jgi:hypothetical protein